MGSVTSKVGASGLGLTIRRGSSSSRSPGTAFPESTSLLACVHYGPTQGQCQVKLPYPDLRGKTVQLRDLLSPACYERAGDELHDRGLFVDMPPWGYHLFEMVTVK